MLCGEIVGMPLASLQSLVGNVYRPMLGAQEFWGKCSDEQVICEGLHWFLRLRGAVLLSDRWLLDILRMFRSKILSRL